MHVLSEVATTRGLGQSIRAAFLPEVKAFCFLVLRNGPEMFTAARLLELPLLFIWKLFDIIGLTSSEGNRLPP